MVTPLVYAHRGASAAAPENTIEAYELAAVLGADGVELDVRRSADGELVLHHDPHLADGRLIAATVRAELPAWLPSLREALDVCGGLIVNIEIKNIPYEPDFDPECVVAAEVVALLAEREGVDEVLMSSFHLRTVDQVKTLAPHLPTALIALFDPLPVDALVLVDDRGHDAVHPHEAFVDPAFIEAARGLGVAVNPWTVDDPDRIAVLADLGVDGLVTNVPDVARQVIGARSIG